jgi:hypothetical protein
MKYSLSDNKTKEAQELLVILNEECGEVSQQICKILRHGIDDTHPVLGLSNEFLLEEEIGDLLQMIDQVVDACDLCTTHIQMAKTNKKEKLKKWLKQVK